MISNQILQSTIDGLKTITRRDFFITDIEAKVVASTEENQIGMHMEIVEDFVNSQAESQLIQGYHYFKVFDENTAEYVVAVRGEDEEVYRIGKLAAFQIQSLLVAYKERYDKDNFIKNLLLDNLLLVDIYNRAKKLHIENNVPRVVYLIETQPDKDINIKEVVRSIFPSKSKDFVTAVDERNIILVKEVKEKELMEDKEKVARMIYDTLSSEAMSTISVAVGTMVEDLKDVSRSYKEAKMALEVGKIFYSEKHIISYNQLGIGRLIYQLPVPLCHMFVKEVLHGRTIEEFDEEILTTVQKFFENNLNVSETSRQLYIHRNTLVYRLDKLQKMTGLDLRNFEDAITFKITMMVSKYMNYMEKMSY
ncbi:MAG: carbohydrate diacid regulator [Epulopiscium sp.]|jgi:carbohydrate diacid regulator|uniref:PucR family transcriptional regulator n=1 Tax=Defluviitalea raffinosedens TaxID=1450156 RepID=A0A7C8LD70_9FIRM|nr:helix-turn-helix domain-containing protein [Defluviitalea raffinosedens]MBZ4667509.1 cdaR [Defluviitaleaceae bacterium]MDK2787361.1 carbohydrate diacid regulator [Candidatus Epulonipiscium sp.]KAE9635505.1 PucR family transcriptional regulator [Defluviitalea raffinosedens]MBM7684415.1 carbohydrate diacid regulator [Defluviitalea raffinosedens]HHW68478.1 PucR family transcriptional regulator [Candidatus Epulonipiscium sp.]